MTLNFRPLTRVISIKRPPDNGFLNVHKVLLDCVGLQTGSGVYNAEQKPNLMPVQQMAAKSFSHRPYQSIRELYITRL